MSDIRANRLPPGIVYAIVGGQATSLVTWLATPRSNEELQEALVLASGAGQTVIVDAVLSIQPLQSRLRSLYDAAYGNHHETLDRLRQGAEPVDWHLTQCAYLGDAARCGRPDLVEVLLMGLEQAQDASVALFEGARHQHAPVVARVMRWALGKDVLPGLLAHLRQHDVRLPIQASAFRQTLDDAVRLISVDISDEAALSLIQVGQEVGLDTQPVRARQEKRALEQQHFDAAPAPLRLRL